MSKIVSITLLMFFLIQVGTCQDKNKPSEEEQPNTFKQWINVRAFYERNSDTIPLSGVNVKIYRYHNAKDIITKEKGVNLSLQGKTTENERYLVLVEDGENNKKYKGEPKKIMLNNYPNNLREVKVFLEAQKEETVPVYFEVFDSNDRALDSAKIKIGDKIEYSNDQGIATFNAISTKNSHSVEISHKYYSNKSMCYEYSSTYSLDTIQVSMIRDHFPKLIKIQDANTEAGIPGLTVSFSDHNISDITDSVGIVYFDFVPEGNQIITISGIDTESYPVENIEEYVSVGKGRFYREKTISIKPKEKRNLTLKGNIKDEYGNVLPYSEIKILDAAGYPIRTFQTDNTGYFEKKLAWERFKSPYQFQIQFEHEDFDSSMTQLETISYHEYAQSEMVLNDLMLKRSLRRYEYRTIIVNSIFSEIDSIFVKFLDISETGKEGEWEKGTILNEENRKEIRVKIRVPIVYRKVILKVENQYGTFSKKVKKKAIDNEFRSIKIRNGKKI